MSCEQEIAEMFVTVGMCQEAVEAYLKVTTVAGSIDLEHKTSNFWHLLMCKCKKKL